MECKEVEQQKAYCKMLNNYGFETQERQLIEEMAELTQALNKRWRAEKGFIEDSEKIIENIAEEAADVIICLKQIIFALNIKSDVEEWKEKKIRRIKIMKVTITNDNINPSHYRIGIYEPRKVIADWKLNYNRGNAIKYIARAGHKPPLNKQKEIEDLMKAIRYLEFEIEELKKEEGGGSSNGKE